MITVVTAVFGDYDDPKPPPPGGTPVMFCDGVARVWGDSLAKPASTLPPRYRSKGPKCMPQTYGIDGDVVWIDGSLRTTGKDVRSLVELVPPGCVGAFKHRFRDCIVQEAEASAAIRRYDGEPVLHQAEQYLRDGHPRHWGLWETGCLVWRGAQHTLGVRWLAEQTAWSSQDQVSFPYVARKLGTPVVTLPGTSVENDWFRWEQHKRVDW